LAGQASISPVLLSSYVFKGLGGLVFQLSLFHSHFNRVTISAQRLYFDPVTCYEERILFGGAVALEGYEILMR
jgi:hypothetical protein